MASFNLKGSIVAIVTPFKADGSIDVEAFDGLIEFHLENQTDGIVVCGTTGETPTLTKEEDAFLIERTVQKVNGKVPVIAGTGSNSTQDCITYTQKAKEIGVDAALIVGPYYNKPTNKGMYEHFSAVARAVDIPIILYNVPSRTGSAISVDVSMQLANDFENIIGIKEATGDLSIATDLLARRPEGFRVYSGDDFMSTSMNLLGADGCISVIANVIPQEFSQLMKVSLAGEVKKSQSLFFKYLRLMDLMFVEPNPMPVKTALAAMGNIQENFRSPMSTMEDHNKKLLIEEMKKLNII
jgi:4-hydroxy-tetrahydrodipicolinate synthase